MFLRKKLWQCLLIPYISYLPMCTLFFGAGPSDFPATDIADVFIYLSIVSQITSKIGVIVKSSVLQVHKQEVMDHS